MGIDIYANWEGMTEAEYAAQITGWSVEAGHVGYLCEHHGAPYATWVLLPEAFEIGLAYITAANLAKRLPEALAVAEERQHTVHGETDPAAIERVLKSYRDFVELCARKERETGHACLIAALYY